MHVHTSEVVISQCNSIANNEKPPPHNLTRPSLDAFRPWTGRPIPGRVYYKLFEWYTACTSRNH